MNQPTLNLICMVSNHKDGTNVNFSEIITDPLAILDIITAISDSKHFDLENKTSSFILTYSGKTKMWYLDVSYKCSSFEPEKYEPYINEFFHNHVAFIKKCGFIKTEIEDWHEI